MSALGLAGLFKSTNDEVRNSWEEFNPLAVWIAGLGTLGGSLTAINWGDILSAWVGRPNVATIQGVNLLNLIDFRYVVIAFIFSVVARVLLRPLFSRIITVMVGQYLNLLSFVYLLMALRGLFSFQPLLIWLYVFLVIAFVAAVAMEAAGGVVEMAQADADFGWGARLISIGVFLLFLFFSISPLVYPLKR